MVAVSVLTTFTTPYFIKMAPSVADSVERHLPGPLRFLITRYHTDATKEKAEGTVWRATLGRGLWRLALYSIVLIAIALIARHVLLGWLDGIVPGWSNLLALVITFAAMSPFLAALVMPLSRIISAKNTNIEINVGSVIVAVFGFIIALIFIVNTITWCYALRWGFTIAIAFILIAILVFSRRVRVQMGNIENRFIDNLNERDYRRSGKNNNLVSDLHLAYMTVGTGCDFVGERLKNSNIRPRYGVNLVSIQRGTERFVIPGGDMRLYPGDVVGVIGNDEQLEKFLTVVEHERTTPVDAAKSGDFQLFSILLKAGNRLIGLTPRTSHLREDCDALVVAVQRDERYIDNNPDLTFDEGDIVWLVGDPKRLKS